MKMTSSLESIILIITICVLAIDANNSTNDNENKASKAASSLKVSGTNYLQPETEMKWEESGE
jgi:hypothetical protein